MAFCYKCGKQIDDEMRFCPVCGASLANVSNVQNTVAEIASNDGSNAESNKHGYQAAKGDYVYSRRKKKRIIIVSIAATIAVIVSAIVLFVFWNRTAYVANVREWRPYEKTMNIDCTLGEVFDGLAPQSKWRHIKKDGNHVVVISGEFTDSYGIEREFSYEIKVSNQGKQLIFKPQSIKVVTKEDSSIDENYDDVDESEYLEAIFAAYDENIDISLVPVIAKVFAEREAGMTHCTVTDSWIEFDYPSTWDYSDGNGIVISENDLPANGIVQITIDYSLDEYGVLDSPKKAEIKLQQEGCNVWPSEVIYLGDVAAVGIRWQREGIIHQDYYYEVSGYIQLLRFSATANVFEIYSRWFSDIIETYAVVDMEPIENGTYLFMDDGWDEFTFYVENDYSDAIMMTYDNVVDAHRIDHSASDDVYYFIPDMDDWRDTYYSSFYITANGGIEVIGFWIDDYGVVRADYYFWQDWNPYAGPRLYYSCTYEKIEE